MASLWKTLLFWIAASSVVWTVVTPVPGLIQIGLGRATGIGIMIPKYLRGLPEPIQVPIALLWVPFVFGSIGGCLWHFFRHR